jgi:NitT/TauT family transport system permease protein
VRRRSIRATLRARPELVLSPLLLVVVLIAWDAVVNAGLVSRILLPSVGSVASAFVNLVTAPWFPQHLIATTVETVVGFVAGSALAIALAAVLHHVPLVRRVLYPYVLTFQLTPSIVLAPIFIIFFGLGIASKIVVSLTTSFFVVLITSLSGFDAVDRDAVALMRSLSAGRMQIFRMLTFPMALPFIFTGLRTATALALIGALVGEFITAQVGLGMLLTQFTFNLRQDNVFATVIVVVLLGMVLFGAVELVYRRVVTWR